MNFPLSSSAWTLCCGALLLLMPPARGADGEWKTISETPTLAICAREHVGSGVKEVRAVGTFPVPNWVVKNVLDDVEHYTQFMPYVVESRVLKREKGELISYARVSPPLISERDYAIVAHDQSHESDKGPVYKTVWQADDDMAPPEKHGVVRIRNNEGSWLLEPIDNGEHTRGTYTLWTDAGGGVPAFILNGLNKTRLTDLFAAIGKQIKDERYRRAKPALP